MARHRGVSKGMATRSRMIRVCHRNPGGGPLDRRQLSTEGRMHKLGFVLAGLLLLGSSDAMAQSSAGERFDGNWLTKLTCPAKGNTQGYTWQFSSVIQNSHFRGEHGTAGNPGYLLIEGKIGEEGKAKLAAN